MQYFDDHFHLRVEIRVKNCNVPEDELARMQRFLEPLGEMVKDFSNSELRIDVIRHPRSLDYSVTAKLRVPGQTMYSGDRDPYLDSAFQRCVRKLSRKSEEYGSNPKREAVESAEKRDALGRAVLISGERDTGPLAEAARAGDYRAFRLGLAGYEEWLRKRVGRWIQRYPQAEVCLGDGMSIGDMVEEVYLNAFEGFSRRPVEVPLHAWLDRLIDPSLRMMLRHPDEESENAGMACTLREAPLGQI